MQILRAHGGIADTNAWLIADESTGKAVLFDAPNDTTATLLDQCQSRGWDLVGLWFTHGHFDHVADHAVVTSRFPHARLLLHAADENKLTGDYPRIFPLPFTIPPRKPDSYISEGERLSVGSLKVEVLHSPGHSAGHVVYHFPEQNIVVSGDMIILRGIGRTDLPDSDEGQMSQSLRRLSGLPRQTTLLPGHGTPSTLEVELQSNRLLQWALRP